MHHISVDNWKKNHEFVTDSRGSEVRTVLVIALTFITMLFEITAGYHWGSMALLADGWHMGTHVSALLITYIAYYYARTRKNDERFSYGTGKIGVLGGYTSAVLLALVSFYIAYESFERFIYPGSIGFNESISVAVIGLIVNLVSALLLGSGDHHGHSHSHTHNEEPGHQHHKSEGYTDHNLRAAYLHVLADALTSVFAIAALLAGKYMGWVWLDPLTGILGAVIIIRWAYSLLIETAPILVDGSADKTVMDEIRNRIESYKDVRVVDLHMWRVSASHYSLQMSIVAHDPEPVENYYKLLEDFEFIDHLSIEVFQCNDTACIKKGGNYAICLKCGDSIAIE